MSHTKPLVGILLGLALSVFASSASAQVVDYPRRNQWDLYRWPWTFGHHWRITQGWDGDVSHNGSLYYALDLSSGVVNQPIWVARDGTAVCEDLRGSNLGWAVRVTHGANSDIYGHPHECSFSGQVPVAQGRAVGYTGTTGANLGQYDDHLHFQVNTTVSGRTSTAFTMEGISDFDHDDVFDNWADSDNLSAGYTLPPVMWEQALHDKYLARGGWSIVGSTAFLWDFSPGRSPGSLCGSGPTEGWYQCGFYDINGVWRDGRIQTFRGTGSGDGQHAVFKRSSGSAVFMSRGILGPLTTLVGAYVDGHDVVWLVGYPTSDSYWISGTQVRMDFQNGYVLYTPATCASIFYWYSADNARYYPWDAADACD